MRIVSWQILGLSHISFLPLSVMTGVGGLNSLEVLNLSGLGNMSDRTLQELSRATTLKYLDLSQNGIFCKVTNKGDSMTLASLRRSDGCCCSCSQVLSLCSR